MLEGVVVGGQLLVDAFLLFQLLLQLLVFLFEGLGLFWGGGVVVGLGAAEVGPALVAEVISSLHDLGYII